MICKSCKVSGQRMVKIGYYETAEGAYIDYYQCSDQECGWRQPLGSLVTSKWMFAVTVADSDGDYERFAYSRIRVYDTYEEADAVLRNIQSLGRYILIERYGPMYQLRVRRILCWAESGDPQTISEFYAA